MKASVTERGQIIIPKPLRDSLGIARGTVLEFREEDGRLVAEKVCLTDPVSQVWGCLSLGKSTDELVAELRGD